MDIAKKIAFILLIIGGLNWGLVGLFSLDLVAFLPGILATIVYILVGVSAVVVAFSKCDKGMSMTEAEQSEEPMQSTGSEM